MLRPSTATLEGLLAEAQGLYLGVVEALKGTPPQWPVYGELLEREGQLAHTIEQVKGQIAAAQGRK